VSHGVVGREQMRAIEIGTVLSHLAAAELWELHGGS
jgi:hypothetical protein